MQTHCLHVMQWPLMVNWMARWSMETIKTNWDLLVLVPLSELLACVDVVEAVDVEVVLAVVVGGCRERDLVRNDARHRDEDQEAWILCAIFRPEKVICPILVFDLVNFYKMLKWWSHKMIFRQKGLNSRKVLRNETSKNIGIIIYFVGRHWLISFKFFIDTFNLPMTSFN